MDFLKNTVLCGNYTGAEPPPLFEHHTEVQPCPERVARIISDLQTAISTRSLSPDLARKLAGKCSFTATQLFGRVGRFAIRTLYDHAFSRHESLPNHAIPGLQALTNILQHSYPRQVPHHPTPMEMAIIYTDAFYKPGEVPIRSTDLLPDQSIELNKSASNGWAAVLFSPHQHQTVVLFGHVPHKLLLQFAHNNAFIYFLKRGQPSLHQFSYNHSLHHNMPSFVTTKQQRWPSSRAQANTSL